ncbi:hypothetical protein BS47DRAFT_1246191, partial [Hydnum rufescens UP504]
QQVVAISGVGLRTIQRWMAQFQETGSIDTPVGRNVQCGPPRKLNEADMLFLDGTLSQRPDYYLDELQKKLLRYRSKQVSLSTIWRALRNHGYKLKKV